MRNIKITLAYDGGDFSGWQVQPGQVTVQGTLLGVLERITHETPTLHGAGRTDAGVHAWGQVASFETGARLSPAEFLRAMNALLPPTVRVREAVEVAPGFHARWHALAKTYRYRIYRGSVLPPERWRYVLHDPWPLNFAAMAEAALCFEGDRDFSTFAASTGSEQEDEARVMVRSIYSSRLCSKLGEAAAAPDLPADARSSAVSDSGVIGGTSALAGVADMPLPPVGASSDFDEWVYVVRGRSFLRNMVRKMVGTLLDVGRGKFAPSDIPHLIALRDRNRSGPTAPPHGLSLDCVEYSASSNELRAGTERMGTEDG